MNSNIGKTVARCSHIKHTPFLSDATTEFDMHGNDDNAGRQAEELEEEDVDDK